MALINNTDRYHLYYLIVNDIHEDKYDGLSHVAEHALLIPTDIGIPFAAHGYTCMSHVCLHFTCDVLENLQEIDRRIMRIEAITDENVSCAKDQVVQEIISLRDKTGKYERLVSFVTEKRIQISAMGDPAEISHIQTEDIVSWFREKQQRGQLYRFLFRDAHDMIMSTEIPNICTYHRADEVFHQNCTVGDSYLYAVPPCDAKTVQIYFQIHSLFSKEEVIKKALYEFCIQRKIQDSLGIELTISDTFFDTDERFILVEIPWNNETNIKNLIWTIRAEISNICLTEFQAYLKEFVDFISLVMRQRESNSEIMNSLKNAILYSKPRVTFIDLR